MDLIWRKLFSCFKCKAFHQIPFIALMPTTLDNPMPESFVPFQLRRLDWTSNPNFELLNINCLYQNSYSFGYDESNQSLFQMPENCGLGVINLAYSDGNAKGNKGSDDSKLALYCAACMPGFKSQSHKAFPFIKVSCIPIENCRAEGTWFNYCSQCESDFVHLYDLTNNNIYYDQCIPNQLPYCQASEI